MVAADQDARLLNLQIAVMEARMNHEDLVERQRIMAAMQYLASAEALKKKVDRAFSHLQRASATLASHISKKQRGLL